jgi:hypothetical protein
MINLDSLQEQRYFHTSGQQMRVPPSDSTGSIPRQTIRTFEEVSTVSRNLSDASNLTAKSVSTATVLRLLLLTVWQIDNSELRMGDVSDNFAVISRQEKTPPLRLM